MSASMSLVQIWDFVAPSTLYAYEGHRETRWPNILIIAGRFAAGKTSTVEGLIENPQYRVLPGDTTRARRDGDVSGEYRYWKTEHWFRHIIRAEKTVQGTFPQHGTSSLYALRKSDVRRSANDQEHVYTRPLSPKAALQLTAFANSAVRVLMLPDPTEVQQYERGLARGDTEEIIERRLADEAKWPWKVIESAVDHGLIVRAEGQTIESYVREAQALVQAA